jgi:hypothetical protein
VIPIETAATSKEQAVTPKTTAASTEKDSSSSDEVELPIIPIF